MKRLSSFVTIVLLLLAIIAGSLCKQWLTAENQKVQSNAGVSNTEGNSPASASSLAPLCTLLSPVLTFRGELVFQRKRVSCGWNQDAGRKALIL